MSATFYLSIDCGGCGEEVIGGLSMATENRNGHPVIPVDLGAQASFTCGECGGITHTSELPTLFEHA